jgi:hypothetical protein
MMLIKSDPKAEAGVLPDQRELAAMGAFNDEMLKAGVMLAGEGFHPSAKGTRVRRSAKKTTVIEGPFGDPRKLVAGFWVIQADNLSEAAKWAKRVPGQDGEVELRPLFEVSDFPVDPAETPDGWREQEERMRAATAIPPAPTRKPGTKRYITMLKGDERTESDAMPTEKVLAEMGALMTELSLTGALLSCDGLKPSSKGARVKLTAPRTVIDGPFAEAKELVAGYCIIQVATKEEAVAFAKRWIEIHADGVGAADSVIEIRQLFEAEDFPS